MSRIRYTKTKFNAKTLNIIEAANTIIEEYQADGYVITLRQLYYQFVARDLILNLQTEYKRLGSIINDARLGGLIDWDAIEDRTRNLERVSSWNTPADIIETAANSFRLDLWESQPERVEVWVEKEALAGIVERAAQPLRVPFFCCRGYVSQSEMHAAAMRLRSYCHQNKKPTIIHLGDHDPSGLDMTRDIQERLEMFLSSHGFSGELTVNRIALNFDQIKKYNPPPNPAKMTDSRFGGYEAEFGSESWELDALDPKTLNALITSTIRKHIVKTQWEIDVDREESDRANLANASSRWGDVEQFLEGE